MSKFCIKIWNLLLIIFIVSIFQSCRYITHKKQSLINSITQPISHTNIGRTIDCRGTVIDTSKVNHYWIAVEIKTNDSQHFFWPKEPEIIPDSIGNWNIRIFEDGENTSLNLVLFGANDSGHQVIKTWFDKGRITGKYPGFKVIPNAIQLARVEKLRLN